MASLQLYIQKMFADMQTALSSVQTDMAAQTLKMDDQITELQNVVTAISQTVNAINVAAIAPDKIAPYPASFIDSYITSSAKSFNVSCLANGVVKISTFAENTFSSALTFTISINVNGIVVKTLSNSVPAHSAIINYSTIIPIVKGDEINIQFSINSPTASIMWIRPGSGIEYELYDITNNPPFLNDTL